MKRIFLLLVCLIGVVNAETVSVVKKTPTAVVFVAASDAMPWEKAVAKFQCDGTDDQDTINSAMGNDRVVWLSTGMFNITNAVIISYNNLVFKGSGFSTIINKVDASAAKYAPTYNDHCAVLQSGANYNVIIADMDIRWNHFAVKTAAQGKCLFINGAINTFVNPPTNTIYDITKNYKYLIEGVKVSGSQAEGICIDYSEDITVRNCKTSDTAWAGITLAFVRYGNVYGNFINRPGIYNLSGGTLGYGLNIHSCPNSSWHDNYIRNGHYGGIGICNANEDYQVSEYVSVYGNQITSPGKESVYVAITGSNGVTVPRHLDIYSNHVKANYIASCTYVHSGHANGARNLSKSGTTPFLGFEKGDKVYLTAGGGVTAAMQYVAKVADDYSWIQIAQTMRFTPSNVEIGDSFSITMTADGVSDTISFVATTTDVKDTTLGLKNAANTAAYEGRFPWTLLKGFDMGTSGGYLYFVPYTYAMDKAYTATIQATNGGSADTQTIAIDLDDYLASSGTVGCIHGTQTTAVGILDGTDIKLHNNHFDGYSTGGAVIMYDTLGQVASCTIDSNGGKVRLTKAGRFDTDVVGTTAYCDFSATYTDGKYTVLSQTVDAITIDLTYSSSAPTATVNVSPDIFEYDNYYGPNNLMATRILLENANNVNRFQGQPTTKPVHRTAATICNRYPNKTIFTNFGATAAVPFTLPNAVPNSEYSYLVLTAQELRVTPATGETINAGLGEVAGDYIFSATVGSWATVKCIVPGRWMFYGSTGWDDQP